MAYNPDIHHRRSIRLKNYDYSKAGMYFITICTHHQQCLFGDIVDGKMNRNALGHIVGDEWVKTTEIRKEIEMDQWIVMPNHFHGIMAITDHAIHRRDDRPVAPTIGRVTPIGPKPRSVGAVMAGFKSAATKRINTLRNTPGEPVWQRNYWEHIIRNESELNRIRVYIEFNPARWQWDKMNPESPDQKRSQGIMK